MKNSIKLSAAATVALVCSPSFAHSHPVDPDDDAHHENKIVKAGEGEAVENPFHGINMLLSNTENEGKLTVYEFNLPPLSPGSPPHTHTLEDEYFFVVGGALCVLAGDDVVQLNAGDFAALTRGNTHMFWNGSEEPVKLIMATTGSSFESFMESVAPALAEAKPADAEAAGAVIGKLAAEHGIKISMDKMPAEAAPIYQP